MEQVLRDIIARIAEVRSDFPLDAHLRDDLNVDSFRAAEIVFEIERVLKTKVSDEHFVAAQTFNDVLLLLSAPAAERALHSS